MTSFMVLPVTTGFMEPNNVVPGISEGAVAQVNERDGSDKLYGGLGQDHLFGARAMISLMEVQAATR